MQRDIDKRQKPNLNTVLTLAHLQLPDGLKPVHFIFPQLHVFPQNLLALPGLRDFNSTVKSCICDLPQQMSDLPRCSVIVSFLQ